MHTIYITYTHAHIKIHMAECANVCAYVRARMRVCFRHVQLIRNGAFSIIPTTPYFQYSLGGAVLHQLHPK